MNQFTQCMLTADPAGSRLAIGAMVMLMAGVGARQSERVR